MSKLIPIVFDKNSRDFILNSLDKTINENGCLVEKNNQKQKVLTKESEELKPDDVGIIRPGSQIFIKKDIVSLIKFASDLI